MDIKLLDDFSKRVKNISKISVNKDLLEEFIIKVSEKEWIKLESKMLESQILEYLIKKQSVWKSITEEDFDLIFAYQLLWKYDEFMKWSNDKLASYKSLESKHMIQIQALLKEYGDPIKDSIRDLERVALKWDDAKYFKWFTKELPKEVSDLKKDKIINSLIRSFNKRPESSINDEVVYKSIDTKLKWVLQKINISENERLDFSKEFEAKDFQFWEDVVKQKQFKQKWINIVENHFWSKDKAGLNLRNIANIQSTIYNKLQNESNKFETITDENGMNTDRNIFARFSKTESDASARGVGDICIWIDEKMWENENYFELVLFDEGRKKNIGTTMLLNMEEVNWSKYLLFWPNPSIEFDAKVSSEKLYEKISEIVIKFAKDNNYDAIVFNPEPGNATNRLGDFQNALEKSQLKDKMWKIEKIDLQKEYILGNFVNTEYKYKNNLSYLWKK